MVRIFYFRVNNKITFVPAQRCRVLYNRLPIPSLLQDTKRDELSPIRFPVSRLDGHDKIYEMPLQRHANMLLDEAAPDFPRTNR